MADNTKAQLPAGTKWRDYMQHSRSQRKTPNRLINRRLNRSDMLSRQPVLHVVAATFGPKQNQLNVPEA